MNILITILYILLFIVFLSVLIVIHELGHLAMAKAFKVYCFEFSIGMGPAIFKRKRKGGETQFAIRAVPFGGYVSMYDGTPEAIPEGVEVDESRSLKNAKKWKRALIFSAGVLMNVVLSIVIFFVSAWIPQNKYVVNGIKIENTSLAVSAGEYGFDCESYGSSVYGIDDGAIVHFKDGTEKNNIIAALSYANFSFKKTNLVDYLDFYIPMQGEKENDDGTITTYTVVSKEYAVDISKVDFVTMHFGLLDENANVAKVIDVKVNSQYNDKTSTYYYEDFGIKTMTLKQRCSGLGEALKNTFVDFGNGATIIFQSLGNLITKPSSWSQAGGIIAVGFETTKVLSNLGWSYFLYYWGLISVNLAIINILPFPGLDGWHILVLIIEGITRKTIPEKVKNIISFIGLALLILLMIVLVFKDTFAYIFHIGMGLLW